MNAALRIHGKEIMSYVYVPLCKETLDAHITMISDIHILHSARGPYSALSITSCLFCILPDLFQKCVKHVNAL